MFSDNDFRVKSTRQCHIHLSKPLLPPISKLVPIDLTYRDALGRGGVVGQISIKLFPNSEDPDQTKEQSDPALHFLIGQVYVRMLRVKTINNNSNIAFNSES